MMRRREYEDLMVRRHRFSRPVWDAARRLLIGLIGVAVMFAVLSLFFWVLS